jgi:hypothetical protein
MSGARSMGSGDEQWFSDEKAGMVMETRTWKID